MKIESLNQEIEYLKDYYMAEIDKLKHDISSIG